MSADNGKKMMWLRPTMNGKDAEIVTALRDTLPASDSLDQAGQKQLETARAYMSELFVRGISYQRFQKESGLTGFPVDPVVPGLEPLSILGGASPTYFSYWLTSKDPVVCANALKEVLLFRQKRMGEHAAYYRMQLFIDVDTENKQFPLPLETGLTNSVEVMEFDLSQVEAQVPRIQKACMTVSKQAIKSMRVGLGSFAQHEFQDFANLSLYDSKLTYGCLPEFIVFKNIHRRAGKFGWFWRRFTAWGSKKS